MTKAAHVQTLTTHEDFRIDQRTVTMPRSVFAAIADQLEQYQQYGEEMRSIGRGFYPSSPFSPEVTQAIVRAVFAGLCQNGGK